MKLTLLHDQWKLTAFKNKLTQSCLHTVFKNVSGNLSNDILNHLDFPFDKN